MAASRPGNIVRYGCGQHLWMFSLFLLPTYPVCRARGDIGLCRSEASAATVFRALQTHAERVALGPACPSMAGMARPASRAARECGMALSTRHRATQAYPLRDPSNSRPRAMSCVDSRRDRPSLLGGHRYARNVIAIGRCVRPNATHAGSTNHRCVELLRTLSNQDRFPRRNHSAAWPKH